MPASQGCCQDDRYSAVSDVFSIPLSTHDGEQSLGLGINEVGMRVPTMLPGHRAGGKLCMHHTSSAGHQRVVMKDELTERWEESYWQDGIFLCNL